MQGPEICTAMGLTGRALKKCLDDSDYRRRLQSNNRPAVRQIMSRRAALPLAPAEVVEERRAICLACPHFWVDACTHPVMKERNRCNRVESLIKLANAHCVDDPTRWGPWQPPALPASTTLVQRFDENNLAPGQSGKRFNASLLQWHDGYLLAYRDGWAGSCIHIARLDRDLKPLSVHKLALRHRDAMHGREDPRLFIHQGKLHVMFIGVMPRPRLRTNVLYARLDDSFKVEGTWHPQIPGRNLWEKNHGYFSHDGTLYAVYTIAPHRIIKVDGERVERVYETETLAPWSGGEPRGSAPPVRVGHEYWHFFHARSHYQGGTAYSIGLATFEAKPPFRILRFTPHPLMWAEHSTKPPDQYVSCIFPCGAVQRGDDWLVSMGVHDRWCEIHSFAHASLEQALLPIREPDPFAFRPNTNDAETFKAIVQTDEYEMRKRTFGPTDVILDIGGHIGSFAKIAVERGAKHIHCYEPEPSNVAAFRGNMHYLPGVTLWPEGIGDGSTMYFRPDSNPASMTSGVCHPQPPGVPVATISLQTAIQRAGGKVALLKLDCEGGEYAALRGDLSAVQSIVGELHDGPLGHHSEAVACMERAGFRVRLLANGTAPHFWAERP